jgi:hypothetical protein
MEMSLMKPAKLTLVRPLPALFVETVATFLWFRMTFSMIFVKFLAFSSIPLQWSVAIAATARCRRAFIESAPTTPLTHVLP